MTKPSRVPVFSSFVAGWVFLFLKSHRLALRLVLPVGLLLLLQVSGLTPQSIAASSNPSDIGIGIAFLLHLIVTAIIIAGAYRVALGEEHRFFLARLELGPDEVRVIGAKLLLWGAVATLVLGARVISGQLLSLMQTLGIMTASGAKIPPAEFQWFRDVETMGPFIELAPLVLFGLLLIWFGLRYALVFPGIVAERHFGVFSYMALTKSSTWRIALLCILLWVSLIAAMKLPLIALGLLPFNPDTLSSVDIGSLLSLVSTYDLGLPLEFEQAAGSALPSDGQRPGGPVFNPPAEESGGAPPAWLAPLITVGGNVLWQVVFAGALAHAYRSVAAANKGRFS